MKPFVILILLPALLAFFPAGAQTPVIRIDTVISPQQKEVLVPVYFSNFSQVGSITLYLQHTSAIHFMEAVNWHSAFNNGFNLANASGNTIVISCVNYAGVTQAGGKLLDLKIYYYFGQQPIDFLAGCEVTDVNGVPLDPAPVYIPGSITKPLDLKLTPSSNPVCEGDSVQINSQVSGLYGNYTYLWTSVPPGFSSTLPSPKVLPLQNTRYRVSVTSGSLSDTTSVLIRISDLPAPAEALLAYPPEDTVNLQNPVSLSWYPAENATQYKLFIWADSTDIPENPVVPAFNQLSYTPPYLFTEGEEHFWKVNTVNVCAETQGSIHRFHMMPLPNLHITQFEFSTPSAGQALQLTWTVTNDGLGPTTSPIWYDRIYLTTSIECISGARTSILLGAFPNVSALLPGESYTQTKTVILPEDLYGNFFLWCITDAIEARLENMIENPPVPYLPPPYLTAIAYNSAFSNQVKEPGEGEFNSNAVHPHDNFFYTAVFLAVPPVPDLKVTQIIHPLTVFSGQNIQVSYTVKNDGAVTTTKSFWKDDLYLSTDTLFNPVTAFLLKSVPHAGYLPPDSSYTSSFDTLIPLVAHGKFFLYIFTDAEQHVFEYVYDGNNIIRSDTLTVFLSPPPDLSVSDIQIPVSASTGSSVNVKYTVENQGGMATTTSPWQDRIIVSPSPTFDLENIIVLLDRFEITETLPPGGSYTRDLLIELPQDISGPWYFYVITDVDDDVFEHLMVNNNRARTDQPLQILAPDLTIAPFDIPAADSTNALINLPYFRENLGPGEVLFCTSDSIFICPEAIFNPLTATGLTRIKNCQHLGFPGMVMLSPQFKLPDLPNDFYYLYVKADATNDLNEAGNEDNNLVRSNSSIQLLRPDLAATGLSFPFIAMGGQAIVITSTVMNVGSGKVLNDSLMYKISLQQQGIPPLESHLLTRKERLLNLAPQGVIQFHDTVILPVQHPGFWHICLNINTNDSIPEGGVTINNTYVSTGQLEILPGPVPNLHLDTLLYPDTLAAGEILQLTANIINVGEKSVIGSQWADRLYLTTLPDFIEIGSELIKEWTHSTVLKPDSLYANQLASAISPFQAPGLHQLFLSIDMTDAVYEAAGEGDNLLGPFPLYIKEYPFDLEAHSASIQSMALATGQYFDISYTVCNNSIVASIDAYWWDAMYLSNDSLFNAQEDQRIKTWHQRESLDPGECYTITSSTVLPGGISGEYYLFFVCDANNSTKDIDSTNNHVQVTDSMQQPGPLMINVIPAPDLRISTFQQACQVYAGQAFEFSYTIINEGDSCTYLGWEDKLYLSLDESINQGDPVLYTTFNHQHLQPGDSISFTVQLQASPSLVGNYMLILRTDNSHLYYEHLQEEDNTALQLVLFRPPPPSDLKVTSINLSGGNISGQEANLSWTIANEGAYAAQGMLKDGIYLSTDSLFDTGDFLWGSYQHLIDLPPGGTVTRDTVLVLPPLLPGNYFLFLKTDLTRAFSDINEANNLLAGPLVEIGITDLFLGSQEEFTMINHNHYYFKLVVPDSLENESMVITLKGDSISGANELFCRYDSIPSLITYDYKHIFPFQGNQELYIPELVPGVYYFLVTGASITAQSQTISLMPELLHFEIRRLEVNQGGTPGSTTVMVYGSKFTPNMDLYLSKNDVILYSANTEFINSTLLRATFRLYKTGLGTNLMTVVPLPLGFYDVIAKKQSQETAILVDGFEILPANPANLLFFLEYPAHVRPDNVFGMMMEFVNDGLNDIPVPERSLISLSDAPIALDTKDLKYNILDLYLYFREPGGPEDFLRPGAACGIKIFCRSRPVSLHPSPSSNIIIEFLIVE